MDTAYNKVKQEGRQERQGLQSSDTASNNGKQEGIQEGRQVTQGLQKAEATSNKRKQEGRQAQRKEGRQEGRQGLWKVDTASDNKRDKKGEKGDKAPGSRKHHATNGNKKGDRKGDKASGSRTRRPMARRTHLTARSKLCGEQLL